MSGSPIAAPGGCVTACSTALARTEVGMGASLKSKSPRYFHTRKASSAVAGSHSRAKPADAVAPARSKVTRIPSGLSSWCSAEEKVSSAPLVAA